MRPSDLKRDEWLEAATEGIASNAMARSVRRELRTHLAETAAAL